jgi:hypothetical protein
MTDNISSYFMSNRILSEDKRVRDAVMNEERMWSKLTSKV